VHEAEILGTIALAFVPAGIPLARLPDPPFDLTLVVRSLPDRSERRIPVLDLTPSWTIERGTGQTEQNFKFAARPGRYEFAGLEVVARSLSSTKFSLPLWGRFEVHETSCVYLGRIGSTYWRFPPGTRDQAAKYAGQWLELQSAGKITRGIMLYLRKGALVLGGMTIALCGPEDFQQKSPKACEVARAARVRNCIFELVEL